MDDVEKQIKLLWEFSRQFTIHYSLLSSCFKTQNHENLSFQFGEFIWNMLNALKILQYMWSIIVWCTLRRSYHNADSINIHTFLFIWDAKRYILFFCWLWPSLMLQPEVLEQIHSIKELWLDNNSLQIIPGVSTFKSISIKNSRVSS